jgi:ribosome-binding factor A
MNIPGRRQERLSEQIHTEVAEIVAGELKDPIIGFVTVTRVEMTPDLRQAKVWVSALGGEEEPRQAMEGLASAAGYVRRELGYRLRLRFSPQITFLPDRGPEEFQKLESVLQKLHDEHSEQ